MSSRSSQVDTRPIDPNTGLPIGPLAQPGYYAGYRSLEQQKFWDAKTRAVILDRVNNVPPIRFFSPDEAKLLKAICDRVLPQDDRDDSHRIAIVPQIDKRLFENSGDGYRYGDMPPDPEAFRLGLRAVNEIAIHENGRPFLELDPGEQDKVLRLIHDGKPSAAHEIWQHMPVHRFWMLLVSDCVDAYYSHPWAWDEIGFGGPAYPRAYTRLERGEPEPWEVEEERYAWRAHENCGSIAYEGIAGQLEHHAPPGQGGTH